jgi:hypothetical protein
MAASFLYGWILSQLCAKSNSKSVGKPWKNYVNKIEYFCVIGIKPTKTDETETKSQQKRLQFVIIQKLGIAIIPGLCYNETEIFEKGGIAANEAHPVSYFDPCNGAAHALYGCCGRGSLVRQR